MADEVAELSQKQRERLAFIEFRLWFLGDIRRPDLIERFGISPAVASRDFAAYKELAGQNITFDDSRKLYVPTDDFSPVFDHDSDRVLSALSRGFGDGNGSASYLPCEFPVRLNRPPLQLLAIVTRAIHQRKAVRLIYHSQTTGQSEREIVPFALVDSGLRWHARAFDRKTGTFCDLVITRMDRLYLLDEEVSSFEQPDRDIQWNRIVTLELVPHPAQERPEVVERDFGMKDGRLCLNVRGAIAGYVLQQWSVDCSPDHSLDPMRHRLWLKGAPYALHDVTSAALAPGFAQNIHE